MKFAVSAFLKNTVLGTAILLLSAILPFAAAHQDDISDEDWNDLTRHVQAIHRKSVDIPLMHSAFHGRTEEVEWFLASGENPNQTETVDGTALMSASSQGKSKTVKVLLNYGANPNLMDIHDWTALMYAARYGHAKVVKMLLESGANPNQVDRYDYTALLLAVRERQVEAAIVLLENGANLNQADKKGVTALIIAAYNGHAEMVKVLLDAGANPHLRTKGEAVRRIRVRRFPFLRVNVKGDTALDIAKEEGYDEVVRILRAAMN